MAAHSILPAVPDHSGYMRPLGFIPGDERRMSAVPAYADTTELIPEKDWEPFDEWPSVIKIKDQDGRGACNGHAAATTAEMARYVAGMDHVDLSAWYVYAILCNGIDRGSMILDALELLETKGVAPESDVKYGIINPRQLTTTAHTSAARFKIEKGARITTYEELITAVLRRESINLAVCVGNSFNNLDGDGAPGLGSGWCNHAIGVGFGLKRSNSGLWFPKMINSWSEKWGMDGFAYLPGKRIVKAPAFEAYTVKCFVDDTADNTRPPDLIA